MSGASVAYGQTDGSISLDKTEYPIPFGHPIDFAPTSDETPSGRAVFPIHPSGLNGDGNLDRHEHVDDNELEVLIRINDPDFNLSSHRQDQISVSALEQIGPVKVSVIRDLDVVVLGYIGGKFDSKTKIDVGDDSPLSAPKFGPIYEESDGSGIFTFGFEIKFTDGPASSLCPVHLNGDRFDVPARSDESYCILQGDVLQVEYTDPSDASGNVSVVTDTATFVMKDAVLQTDKHAYQIGTEMILTLIEPDFDMGNYPDVPTLDLIGWDSKGATLSIGYLGGETTAFDPDPLYLGETGDSTGVFQTVVKIPKELAGDRLQRDREITLEYVDWSPSSASFVGSESSIVTATIRTSDFGAKIELDQETYTWTDLVHITVVAPDFDLDGYEVDEIGNSDENSVKISTGGFDLDGYRLVETGIDTGIFTGEVILTGFAHDADGDGMVDTNPRTGGSGNTDGFLQTGNDDRITVSFEFSEDESITANSPINWNIGTVELLESESLTTRKSVIKVTDRDMNLDPKVMDSFDVNVRSDTDDAGINITLRETGVATGIFGEGILFSTDGKSFENVLRATEDDTVTIKYSDYTPPSPHTTMNRIDVISTLSFWTNHTDVYRHNQFMSQFNFIDTPPPSTVVPPDSKVTIKLDKSAYTWTERAVITITSHDHNLDGNRVDEIGSGPENQIQIKTGTASLENYKLVETGPDTGVFRGNVTLTGFANHDADGDTAYNDASGVTSGHGPTDGMIAAESDDSITVVFEIADGRVIMESSQIKWNIGTVEWLEPIYPTRGIGTVIVTDMDMNFDPETADSFGVESWTEFDPGGIDVIVTETGKNTGKFKGIVFLQEDYHGSRLQIRDGDVLHLEYLDNTLPHPYSHLDELPISSTATITAAPIISSMDAVSGTYKEGDTIPITIKFNKSVTVTGTPELELETGTRDAVATYAFGSPGTSLEFTHVVSENEETDKLDYAATDSLLLDGGAINSTDDSNISAILVLPSLGSADSLAASDIVIDATAPTIRSIEAASESAIRVIGSEPLAGDVKISDFTVSRGTDITVSAVSISDGVINIGLEDRIAEKDQIALTYSGSSVTDVAGNELNVLYDHAVTNKIAKDSANTKSDDPELESSTDTMPATFIASESSSDPESGPDTIPATVEEPESSFESNPATVGESKPSFVEELFCDQGTYADNGTCKAGTPNVETTVEDLFCDQGTYADNGTCKVDDRYDIYSIIISIFEKILS